jgi:hypothetical protein
MTRNVDRCVGAGWCTSRAAYAGGDDAVDESENFLAAVSLRWEIGRSVSKQEAFRSGPVAAEDHPQM